ncbi:MAG TPA: hypothetical protein VKG44_01645 [Candidatus Baltobacteraceae bacterium]|nr:hypothetical protein [Candidatus Baltobacteraceae bacterium]
MSFALIDGYLLGEPVSKPDAIEALLRERSPEPAAAPFYRALEAVGVRAADEAFVALRLVLAGQTPSDERVRRVRALAAVARACATGDRAGLAKAFKRDGEFLGDVAKQRQNADLGSLGLAARTAFTRELATGNAT